VKRILWAIIGIIALILVAFLAGQLLTPSYPSLAEMEAERLRIEQARALAPLDVAMGAFWRLLPAIVAILLLTLASVWGSLALARFRRRELVRPDGAGLLPVVLEQLPSAAPAALAAYHHTRAIEAGRQPVPHTYSPHITYSPSPRFSYDHRGDASRDAVPPADEPAALLPPVPTFGELLSQGAIGRGQPLLLGVDTATGQTIPGSWLDLYATATAGLPGSGKTTSQRFFAAQTALHGARFVVCDPHAGAADDSLAATLDPLRSVYLVEPASEPRRILEAVRYVAALGQARITGKSQDRTPIILWVDELTSLLGRSDVGDDLAALLEQIAQEYRKRGIYLSASGQIWTASRTTSELRDSLSSVLCHRMKRSQARLLLPTEEAQIVERLETGEAVLWRTSGVTTRVKIPNTTGADIARVAERLGQGPGQSAASTGPTIALDGAERTAPARLWPGHGRAMDAPNDGTASAVARAKQEEAPLDAESARILAQFAAGVSLHDVAGELAGTNNPGARAYKEARARVEAILQRLAAGTLGGARAA
jgi:hypothetical protein